MMKENLHVYQAFDDVKIIYYMYMLYTGRTSWMVVDVLISGGVDN